MAAERRRRINSTRLVPRALQRNYSHNAVPVFQITGPSNQQYDGTFCLPQVPLPANYTPQVGDNATIQIIEVAQHGASLYNVRFPFPHCYRAKNSR
jgi:hypothetical protein